MNAITNPALVGRKMQIRYGDDVLLATITELDITYPRTAYRVSWTRIDNPHFDAAAARLPEAKAYCSTLHASCVLP